ncbi:MAG TPA: hypothetical protein VEZ17_02365, partial [Chitinophagaceae bacterium]|nr:hypothetical protein [Chitinophagaceae bacterium]
KKNVKRERVNTIMKQEEEEGEIVFRTHSIFGVKLATDGYGILYERGKYISPKKTNLLQFELNEKISKKEEKTTTGFDIFGNVSQAKYGKANNFFQFKAGVGQQYTIGGKTNKNGVAVTALYAGGLSLGLIKPYYVDVQRQSTRERLRVKFTDTLPQGDTYTIIGNSGFTVGWDELKLSPGLHAKTALRFDYGRFNEMVSAIEAGINAEFYASKIKQMGLGTQFKSERQFFFNAYVALEFGRRK